MSEKEEIVDAEIVTEDGKVRNEEIVEAFTKVMTNIYLSGPMTGIENYNHELFDRVAAEFRSAGFFVCSPAEFFDGDLTKERSEYMREAIKYLLEADTIMLLPGWQGSKGARLEAAIATELELNIVEYIERDTPETDQELSMPEGETYKAIFTPVDEESNFGTLTPVQEDK